MNVKLKVLTVGALFFIGGQAVMAQKKKDSLGEKKIDEVVIVGFGQKKTVQELIHHLILRFGIRNLSRKRI